MYDPGGATVGAGDSLALRPALDGAGDVPIVLVVCGVEVEIRATPSRHDWVGGLCHLAQRVNGCTDWRRSSAQWQRRVGFAYALQKLRQVGRRLVGWRLVNIDGIGEKDGEKLTCKSMCVLFLRCGGRRMVAIVRTLAA